MILSLIYWDIESKINYFHFFNLQYTFNLLNSLEKV